MFKMIKLSFWCLYLKEREEETKKIRLQKVNDEAEQRRLAAELEARRNKRIQREMEEKDREEAQLMLEEAKKLLSGRGKKPPIIETVS
jgi:translation initiation factor 3 subunit A